MLLLHKKFGLPKVIRPEMEQAQEEALPPEDFRAWQALKILSAHLSKKLKR